ncbi:ABC transporter ATP-binding protein [Methyloterricola oryzae]|uniref:ABC transporter ATP-binding protein n=1 Tax=Methyloterricola oryzae TaxID=1495050 RepID=UPI0005EBB464|nr:ATP-binding cassette domain-containing protein [Methyloterricola oryzae]
MIHIRNLHFSYPGSEFRMDVTSLTIEPQAKVAIIGPSGSGKSTLLKLIAGIIPAQSGSLSVDGAHLQDMDDGARRNFRVSRIGFVFQELELLDYLNVLDNILHTYRINHVLKLSADVRQRARLLADDVGLGGKLEHMPSELSQGERQRAAVCRALLPKPKLLLADEATGNLDPVNKQRILDLLFRATDAQGAGLIAVTHDHELLPRFDRVIDFSALH